MYEVETVTVTLVEEFGLGSSLANDHQALSFSVVDDVVLHRSQPPPRRRCGVNSQNHEDVSVALGTGIRPWVQRWW